jgi:hypothetical protein
VLKQPTRHQHLGTKMQHEHDGLHVLVSILEKQLGILHHHLDTILCMALPSPAQVLLEHSSCRSSVDLPNAEDETPMMAALMALHAAQQQAPTPPGRPAPSGHHKGQRELRNTTASACLIIARLLEAGANANDSSAVDPVKGHPAPYSTALLACLEYGMDDLAVLLHLHGARMPPGSSGSLAAARPDSV